MDPKQLRTYIVEPALHALGARYASESAVILLLATSAVECRCGDAVRQYGRGPARGAYQQEPATLHDLYANYLQYHPSVMVQIGREDAERLVYDWRYATWCARLDYYREPTALPQSDDVDGMWAYYKRYWNSPQGATSEAEFRSAWGRYVAPVL